MPRKLESWVDAFVAYTEPIPSPEIYRRWCGLATLAAAIERKMWVHTFGRDLYPNLYVVLVGGPAAGKTFAIDIAQDLFDELKEHKKAKSNLSRAALMDQLNHAERRIVLVNHIPPVIMFNSLFIASNELSVLLPAYDPEMLAVLTDIYDCKRYGEAKRTQKIEINIAKPQFNILAGTTPSFLNEFMHEGAWDQGFISRVMMVYSGYAERKDPFSRMTLDEKLKGALISDLTDISKYYGKLTFHPDAAKAIREWHLAGGEPAPTHPRLRYYNSRRTAHLLKLCTLASADRGDSYEITMADYLRAHNWMSEMEKRMEDIFKEMATGGTKRVMEEIYHFCFEWYLKKGKQPVPLNNLMAFVAEKVPVHEVERIVSIMEKSGLITKVTDFSRGICYKPEIKKH